MSSPRVFSRPSRSSAAGMTATFGGAAQDAARPRAEPFTIAVPDAVLADLRDRLERTRWPDQLPGTGWDYGTDTAYLKELVAYWQNGFDWRAQEKRLNGFHHYRAAIDGTRIHFIHERSRDPNATPLLLLHGWPSSFVQMLDIIPLLTDPAAHGMAGAPSFHVVVASLPGFGFSDPPARTGVGLRDLGAAHGEAHDRRARLRALRRARQRSRRRDRAADGRDASATTSSACISRGSSAPRARSRRSRRRSRPSSTRPPRSRPTSPTRGCRCRGRRRSPSA